MIPFISLLVNVITIGFAIYFFRSFKQKFRYRFDKINSDLSTLKARSAENQVDMCVVSGRLGKVEEAMSDSKEDFSQSMNRIIDFLKDNAIKTETRILLDQIDKPLADDATTEDLIDDILLVDNSLNIEYKFDVERNERDYSLSSLENPSISISGSDFRKALIEYWKALYRNGKASDHYIESKINWLKYAKQVKNESK